MSCEEIYHAVKEQIEKIVVFVLTPIILFDMFWMMITGDASKVAPNFNIDAAPHAEAA